MVARAFVEAGEIDKARPLVAAMASELQAEPRAYAKIVEGEIALKNGDPRQAIEVLTEANTLLDTWLGHFDLGRAYFGRQRCAQFTQADSEFDRCLKRRGEALQLILGDEPTYAYLPPVYYYQGRVREGLKSEGSAESYREYLTCEASRRKTRSYRTSASAPAASSEIPRYGDCGAPGSEHGVTRLVHHRVDGLRRARNRTVPLEPERCDQVVPDIRAITVRVKVAVVCRRWNR